ncbi:hypothetical protein [Nesterenkonia flava]|uniref:Lipoprotein n=1 Tax=Nesterenkonia flava TaxID=469799 RepID=A0ABU1FQV9_9MICC|nr:hypothetical protein [Nesterenkonia flava]MDR5711030.1 hypothetical protein [Nesterenkonia flava]
MTLLAETPRGQTGGASRATRVATGAALFSALVLSACGQDQPREPDLPADADAAAEMPQPPPPRTGEPLFVDAAVAQSLCGLLDQDEAAEPLEAVTGLPMLHQISTGFGVEHHLIFDHCIMTMADEHMTTEMIHLSWSVDTVDAQGWEDFLSRAEEAAEDRPEEISPNVDAVRIGDSAHLYSGERILTVRGGAQNSAAAADEGFLNLVGEAAADLPAPEPIRTTPACAQHDDAVEALLGGPIQAARSDPSSFPSCAWRTDSAVLTATVNAIPEPEQAMQMWEEDAEEVDGPGQITLWLEDQSLITLLENQTLISVTALPSSEYEAEELSTFMADFAPHYDREEPLFRMLRDAPGTLSPDGEPTPE